MDIHTKIRAILSKGWHTYTDLYHEMVHRFDYQGSQDSLSRECRNVTGRREKYRRNKNGVKYKMFRVVGLC